MSLTLIHPEIRQPKLASLLLSQGWTCFRHQDRYWLTQRLVGRRIMHPVPPAIIHGLIAKGFAQRRGVRVMPTLPFIH
jgi:hypothetical protein